MRGWLNLSGDHPLTIYLSIDCDKELARHALYLMLVTMDRWQNVRLEWGNRDEIPALAFLCRNNAPPGGEPHIWTPLLETFELNTLCNEVGVGQLVETLAIIMHNAPKLRHFIWINQSWKPPTAPYKLGIAWTHLSELTLSYFMSPRDCIEIMIQCPLIQSCTFGLVRLQAATPLPISPTVLPHLHTLSINSFINLSNFFDALVLPVLQDVRILNRLHEDEDLVDLEVTVPEWCQGSFISLLCRSSCALEILHLGTPTMSEDDLIECLGLVNVSLKHLYVKGLSEGPFGPFVTSRTLNLLAHHVSTDGKISCFCPNLSIIQFDDCLVSPLPEGALADMIKSRWSLSPEFFSHQRTCGERLTEVILDVRRGVIPIVDARRLKLMQQEGLSLTIEAISSRFF